MGTTNTRAFKVQWILSRVKAAMEQGRTVDKEKLIAVFSLDLNTTRRTALDLLKILSDSGKLKIVDNLVWTPEAYDLEMKFKLNTASPTAPSSSTAPDTNSSTQTEDNSSTAPKP